MTTLIEPTRPMLRLAAHARACSVSAGFWDGHANDGGIAVIRRCRHVFEHRDSAVVVLFTRDIGHHTSGWWKNPDYERCEHLSLSFVDRETGVPAPHDHKRAALWCEAFFGTYKRLLWVEPPYSEQGKARGVYHYRLFMHEDWRTPLLPRGEVYTRDFTDAGWKSFSDLHGAEREASRG